MSITNPLRVCFELRYKSPNFDSPALIRFWPYYTPLHPIKHTKKRFGLWLKRSLINCGHNLFYKKLTFEQYMIKAIPIRESLFLAHFFCLVHPLSKTYLNLISLILGPLGHLTSRFNFLVFVIQHIHEPARSKPHYP